MSITEEAPDYICPACEWQGDEPLVCGHCSKDICPKCAEPVLTIEAYRKAEADAARDAELEDRRL